MVPEDREQVGFDHGHDDLSGEWGCGFAAGAAVFEEHGEGVAGAVGGDVAREPCVVGFVAADLGGAGLAGHEQAGDLGFATGAMGM